MLRQSKVIMDNRWQNLENVTNLMSNMVLRDASKNGIKKSRFFLQGDVLLGPISDYWFALSVCGTQVVATQ